MYLAQPNHSNQPIHERHAIPPALPMARAPSSSSSSQSAPPANNGLIQSLQQPPSQSCRGDGNRIYSLEVKQQPIRARMCGFGDKDRRPITPPPCVRLVVKDATTGKEVDINEVDTSFYVLTVDLWSADASREVNLVRHSATSPSISAATSSSYPPPPPTPPLHPHPPAHVHHIPAHQQQLQHQGYPPPPPQQLQHQQAPGPYPGYHPVPSHAPPPPPQQQNYYQPPGAQGYYQGMHGPPPPQQQPPQQTPSGMFTRNLIGSLSASAFKLTDPDNKIGVWFILQDLSVRTEGAFRLKMNFVNVGRVDGGGLNTGSAPVLASAFSDVFHVFSAKKFPGVIESTGLSKCFATQGIKIPIRRDKGDGPEV
ncbi:unnamed protein product [Tuber melanosporum]|uniref:(Perigord truffle) hypothetical protein n=1 Tax=Tuber melanosporum (strain Mel28) TaxID=656061 RepID=D5GKH4_TUBMM|nr:uncharacterized protein GSTUM_00009560001 [Tuber melanosporum]CAZ85017.1 unnamed protein product [Tuber melanosporum]